MTGPLDVVTRRIDRAMVRLMAEGRLHDYRIDEDRYSERIALICRFRRGGPVKNYILRSEEIVDYGLNGLDCWLNIVERDIIHIARDLRPRRSDDYSWWRGAENTTSTTTQAQEGLTVERIEQAFRNLQQFQQGQWGIAAPDPKAAERSKELFILACGKQAFDTLESNKPLPITGSKGTAYTLHKRSTYCVERVSDHAKLCAVVPNVPLYDHLLGIKLMVENDEPKFLETANVANADPFSVNAQQWNNALAQQAMQYGGRQMGRNYAQQQAMAQNTTMQQQAASYGGAFGVQNYYQSG